jgi:hypothetical protein
MKSTKIGTVSGCVVWMIVFGILGACLLPIAMIIGGITSISNFAMQTLAPIICPDGTTAESCSYPTTTTDEYGNSHPSTAYELHCVDTTGAMMKKDPVLYAFLWIGIVAVIGLGIAALLAFALAAPTGVLIARVLERNKKTGMAANIQPE